MMGEPAFAKLAFGDWARVLDGQVTRGHYGFVLDGDQKVQGFLGWALATRAKADAWADGAELTDEDCRAGDCLIVNAWAEKSPAVRRFMFGALRELLAGKAILYARQAAADGTTHVVRMPVEEAMASGAASPTNTTPFRDGVSP